MRARILVAATLVAASGFAGAAEPVVERVVMMMRHGVRPPTKLHPTPEGTTSKPWPAWSTGWGELTPHGYAGAKLVGEHNRKLFAAWGLLPASGCLKDEVVLEASGKSRAIDTAKAYAEGLAPSCKIALTHPADEKTDSLFHPGNVARIDAEDAKRAASRRAPDGNIASEVARHAGEFALLQKLTDCCRPAVCVKHKAGDACTIAGIPVSLNAEEGGKPAVEGSLGWASTAAQTFLLEYVEGKPMSEVAWGRAAKSDIQSLLRFHTTKFNYEVRPPYIAERYAAGLAKRMLGALQDTSTKGRVTLLVGHDTNIAALGGFFDLHWVPADYPPDSLPPGGALGFELVRDAAGKKFVRAFYQAQSMDQLRELRPLTGNETLSRTYWTIPGCAAECPLGTFQRIVEAKLKNPAAP